MLFAATEGFSDNMLKDCKFLLELSQLSEGTVTPVEWIRTEVNCFLKAPQLLSGRTGIHSGSVVQTFPVSHLS